MYITLLYLSRFFPYLTSQFPSVSFLESLSLSIVLGDFRTKLRLWFAISEVGWLVGSCMVTKEERKEQR